MESCIEAHIATFECEAAEPCYPEPYSCDLPNQLRSYHCWRFDTAYYGWNCGMDATDFASCNEWCSGSSDIREYVLCSAETPDYCQCGSETCQEGEYCCYCQTEW